MEEQIIKMWSLIQWNIIQPFKRIEVLAHVTIWMNLEDSILSKISQSQKDEYWVIPLP